jgi:manganese/zinc/iron transport system permease protein
MNPYFDNNFFGFLMTLFERLIFFFQGKELRLAADEIQLLTLMAVSSSCALIGTFLIYRKMTMLANSLSHTLLLGIVVAYLLSEAQDFTTLSLGSFVLASFLSSLLTAGLTVFLTKTAKLQEDASTGVVFSSLFALGIVLVTIYSRNTHLSQEAVMGNVDALHISDLHLSFFVFLINLVVIFLFYKELVLTTFDPEYAKVLGVSTFLMNVIVVFLCSLTAVGAFRSVGVLMVLSFITAPPLIARVFVKTLRGMILVSCGVGCLISLIGVAFSRHLFTEAHLALSTGGVVVSLMSSLLFFVLFFRKK